MVCVWRATPNTKHGPMYYFTVNECNNSHYYSFKQELCKDSTFGTFLVFLALFLFYIAAVLSSVQTLREHVYAHTYTHA